jgi:hypothetical protein
VVQSISAPVWLGVAVGPAVMLKAADVDVGVADASFEKPDVPVEFSALTS